MTPLLAGVVITTMACLTTILLTLIGVRHYSIDHARRRAYELELARSKETTQQALSLDQVRRSEIELEIQRLGIDDTETSK